MIFYGMGSCVCDPYKSLHPSFTARFQDDLSTPGLRIPLTADRKTFAEAVELGRTLIWLHTFGERMTDPAKGRPPSPLGNIQPDHWLAEYTIELINVLNVLGCLVDLEPTQATLLEKICSGPTFTTEALSTAGAFELPVEPKRKTQQDDTPDLFGSADH